LVSLLSLELLSDVFHDSVISVIDIEVVVHLAFVVLNPFNGLLSVFGLPFEISFLGVFDFSLPLIFDFRKFFLDV
jgi:hypothetical protein